MEKCMTLELGQEIWKMSLEYLVQCEKKKKEVLKKLSKKEATFPGVFPKGVYRKSSPNGQSENNLKMKIYKVVLDFNPKCNINTTSPYWET